MIFSATATMSASISVSGFSKAAALTSSDARKVISTMPASRGSTMTRRSRRLRVMRWPPWRRTTGIGASCPFPLVMANAPSPNPQQSFGAGNGTGAVGIVPGLPRFAAPAMQQPQQSSRVRDQLLDSLPLDPMDNRGDEPARLPHLDHCNQCAILVESGERRAEVIQLWHGHPVGFVAATALARMGERVTWAW